MAMKKWRKQTSPIGSGSHAEVYLAVPVDGVNSSMIAVKSRRMDYAYELQREARILRQLRGCPHIIQCFGDDVTYDKDYNLLLEYAPAGTLDRLIYPHGCWNYKMAESDVAFYTCQILKGLLHLHDKGFVHCDLKPENILVFPTTTREGNNKFLLKLADFGVSTRAGKNDDDEDGDGQPFCPYHYRGSLVFASPDYLSTGIHQTLDDIWSLGCIVVEMFVGKAPWLCKSISDLIYQIQYEKPAIPEDIISNTAKDFLNKCFYKKEDGDDERWTARMLLTHPFVRDNKDAEESYEDAMLSCPNNHSPLSYDDNQGWVSTKDLFQ